MVYVNNIICKINKNINYHIQHVLMMLLSTIKTQYIETAMKALYVFLKMTITAA